MVDCLNPVAMGLPSGTSEASVIASAKAARGMCVLLAGLLVATLPSLLHAEGKEGLKTSAASAQNLPDPTRPPASLAIEEAKDAPSADEKAAAPAGFQTVILRKGKKPVAIINGESVELGGKLGDARLVKLTDSEAVLQGESGKEVFHLTPGIERKNIVPPVAKVRHNAKAKVSKKTRKTKSQPTN